MEDDSRLHMLYRLAAFAVLFLVAITAHAQTPPGLVGRWRVVAPLPPLPPGADGPPVGFTFSDDGSAEIEFTLARATGYRLAEPLVSRGDTLTGKLFVEGDSPDRDTQSYEVEIVGDDLALVRREVEMPPPPVPPLDGDTPAEPEPPRETVSILDFTRVDGPPGSLVGMWALAWDSARSGLTEGESISAFSFTRDSVTAEYSVAIRVRVRGDSLTLYSGDAPGPRDEAVPFRLDGDALTLMLGWGEVHLERAPDAPQGVQDADAFVGRWVRADMEDEADLSVLSRTFGADGSSVSVSEHRQPYRRTFDSVEFMNEPGVRPDRYSFEMNAGMLRLTRRGADVLLFTRASGEPEALVGRWTADQTNGELSGRLTALTFGEDGVVASESVRTETFRLVDGRLEIAGTYADPVFTRRYDYRYRLRYRLDGDTLTLFEPGAQHAPIRLRRDL